MPKIILTEEQHAKVVNLILSEMVQETETLDEGAWEKIKYGLSKLGRYKAGGKIFGKGKVDQEAAQRIQDIISKKGNEVIAKLHAEIQETNPKFPNNEKEVDFLNTVLGISAVYDSIIASTQKNPNEEGYLPVDAANGIINDLREYVKKFLDVDLTSVYSVVDEVEGNVVELTEEEEQELDEAWGLNEDLPTNVNRGVQGPNAKDVRSQLQAKRGQGDDFDSERMKTLKSNRLPLTLMGVGTALGGFSWLVNTDWFKSLFDTITQTTDIEMVNQAVESKSDVFGTIKPGQGMTQLMNQLNNAGLSPNSTPEQFLEQVKALGGGNLQQGIDALSADGGIFANPDQARQVLNDIAQNPHGHGDTLGQIFQGKWAGTGRQVGDMLVTVEGGQLKAMIVKTIVQAVPKIVTKTAITTGAGYAVAKGFASVLGPIGVGLLAAGALVKLMRMKGQRQSRAKTLNDLYQSIRNIDGGAGIVEPQGETIDAESAKDPNAINDKNKAGGDVSRGTSGKGGSVSGDDLYNSLRNLFQFIVNNRKMLGTRAADNVGTGGAMANQRMKAGDTYNYNGQPVTILNPDLGDGRTQVRAQNKAKNVFTVPTSSLQKLNESQLFEGQYIRDKRMVQFLNKNLSFDKLKSFETLMNRVELLRNRIKMMSPSDKVLAGHIKNFSNNPIMATDFKKMFDLSADNPKAANSLKALIDDLFVTLYSGKYKFGSMVDKMATLGGGNINKVDEGDEYNMANPNKAFLKDAQDRSRFKANLLKFLSSAMNLFQYLSKLKKEGKLSSIGGKQQSGQTQQPIGGQAQGQQAQGGEQNQGSEQQPNGGNKKRYKGKYDYLDSYMKNHGPIRYESIEKTEPQINEHIERIKKIMFG